MKFDLTNFLELDTKALMAINGGGTCGGGSCSSGGSSYRGGGSCSSSSSYGGSCGGVTKGSGNCSSVNLSNGNGGGGNNNIELNGSVSGFLENINSLVGGNYVYGGNDPTLDGGVDCSGSILWAINQEGNNIPDQSANALYENSNLIEYVDSSEVRPGDLRFLLDETGTAYHVQVIVDETGARFNATGGPENTINNPGTLEILNNQLPSTGVYGRLNFEN